MGAVTFSLDERLLRVLKAALPLDILVETGTFNGDGIAIARPYVTRVVSVEFSRPLWEAARERFRADPGVEILHGHSADVLESVARGIAGQSALFWLDAHWCIAENTAGEHSQCPLLEELAAIKELNPASIVLIDDARLFLAPPPAPHDVGHWPGFDDVLAALKRLSGVHGVMVVNDVIAFYPRSIHDAMAGFAHLHGVDWLRARQSLEENMALRTAVEEKEDVIRELEAQRVALMGTLADGDDRLRVLTGSLAAEDDEVRALTRMLEKKQAVIEELHGAVRAYRAAFAPLRPFVGVVSAGLRALRRAARPMTPRLGVLNQHPPRELRLPPHAAAPPENAPRISIVTPSFGQARYIERTIESVLGQGYPNLEYHVQDGGSTDGTREILERHSHRLTSWESSPDAGQAEAINRGFARTSGEIMAWLNSDDVLFPGALACVAQFFARHPEVDVLYGHRVLLDDEDREIGRWILPAHSDAVLSWADFVPQETLFWRRGIWNKVGGRVDESFRFAMDWDLLVRFRDAGARFERVPRILGGFRVHPQQKTSAAISDVGFAEMTRIRQRALGRVPSALEIRKALLPYLLKHCAAELSWQVQHKLGAH